jgi:alpha-tubulin suppressor-like RCC1 family protein
MPRDAQPVALVTVDKVSGSDDLACVYVRQDGSLCTPKNSRMDLSWATKDEPVFRAVSSSNASLGAVTLKGDVCFQRLYYSQDHTQVYTPVWYSVGREVCKISVNGTTLYVLSYGELYRSQGAELTRVHLCSATTPAVADVATSNTHTLALSDGGKVFAWGRNDCHQLGCMDLLHFVTDPQDGTQGFAMDASQEPRELPGRFTEHVREKLQDIYGFEFGTLNARVEHLRSVKVKSVHAGLNYSLLLTGGKVLSFGHAQTLGRDFHCFWFLESIMAAEVHFDTDVKIASVCAGECSAHAICTKGCLYAWSADNKPALLYNGGNGAAATQALFSTTHNEKTAVVTQIGTVLEFTHDEITQQHTGPVFAWQRHVEAQSLALCMGGHARLGRDSRLCWVDKELYEMIARYL